VAVVRKRNISTERPPLVGEVSSTASNHSDVFTFTLLLREGRAGEAWEPSNKTILFLDLISKKSLISPMTFQFHFSAILFTACWFAPFKRVNWKNEGLVVVALKLFELDQAAAIPVLKIKQK
jgi:hypothetical protein